MVNILCRNRFTAIQTVFAEQNSPFSYRLSVTIKSDDQFQRSHLFDRNLCQNILSSETDTGKVLIFFFLKRNVETPAKNLGDIHRAKYFLVGFSICRLPLKC